jgi:hypothetical protein
VASNSPIKALTLPVLAVSPGCGRRLASKHAVLPEKASVKRILAVLPAAPS